MRPPKHPHRIWIMVFLIWMVFLSGALNRFIGSPGMIQAARLRSLLLSRENQINDLTNSIAKLKTEADALEHDSLVQKREIRRVLGYAAPDELIFDFGAAHSLD